MSRLVVVCAVTSLAVAVFFLVDPLGVREPAPPATDPASEPAAPIEGQAPTLDIPTPPAPITADREVGPDVELAKADRARDLHGIVQLRDGTPVPGAEVALVDLPWRGFMTRDARNAEYQLQATTRTGPRGTFALRLREGTRGLLVVNAEGYAERRIYLAAAGEHVRVVLDDAVTLVVHVKTSEAKPAAAVDVHVSGAGAGRGPGSPASIQTNDQGIAQLAGLDPGEAVYVWAQPQLEGWGAPRIQRVTLPTSGSKVHEVWLRPARTIRGVVTDAATGQPISDAHVGMGWRGEPATTTDAQGAYVLHSWRGEGVRDMTAGAPGYVRRRKAPDPETEALDFALVKGAVVTGRVVDVSERPVARARVAIVASNHGQGGQRLSMGHGWTNAQGRFSIDGLAADMALSIQVRAVGHGRRIVDIDAVQKETFDAGDIQLGPALTIVGTVTQGGAPLARVPVRLFGANADRAERRASKRAPHMYYGTREDIITDDLGRFVVSDMCAGSYDVIVKPRAPIAQKTVELEVSQPRTEITIEVGDLRTLHVAVLDPDGSPLDHGMASVRYGGKAMNGRLDTKGQTTLLIPTKATQVHVVPFGEQARAELVHKDPFPIPEDADRMVIRLQRAQVIRGVVVKPDGSPIARALVTGTVKGRQLHHAFTDGAGRFSMKSTADDVDLFVSGQVHRDGRQTYVPYVGEKKGVANGTSGVRIETKPLAGDDSLRVRVVGPDGPIEGLTVTLMPYQPSTGHRETDADGVAHFDGLSRIERTVNVSGKASDGTHWGKRTAKATPGGAEVTITMSRPLLVKGVVLGPDEKPVQGAILSVRPVGEQRPITGGHTPADGTFTVPIPRDTPLRFVAYKMIDEVMHMAQRVYQQAPDRDVVLLLKRQER